MLLLSPFRQSSFQLLQATTRHWISPSLFFLGPGSGYLHVRSSSLLLEYSPSLLFLESPSHLVWNSCSFLWNSPPCPPFAIPSRFNCDGCCDSTPRCPCCKSIFSSPPLWPTPSSSLFQVYLPFSWPRLDLSSSAVRFDLLSPFRDWTPHRHLCDMVPPSLAVDIGLDT